MAVTASGDRVGAPTPGENPVRVWLFVIAQVLVPAVAIGFLAQPDVSLNTGHVLMLFVLQSAVLFLYRGASPWPARAAATTMAVAILGLIIAVIFATDDRPGNGAPGSLEAAFWGPVIHPLWNAALFSPILVIGKGYRLARDRHDTWPLALALQLAYATLLMLAYIPEGVKA